MRREFPDRPLVGVGVVVVRDDRVLLVRRARPPRAGEWSLPGGLQKLGETVNEAARREVLEETGVEIGQPSLLEVVDLIDRDPVSGAVRWHYTLVDVRADWVAGEGRAASDAAAVAWVAAADLPARGLWSETVRVVERGLAAGGPGRSSV